MRNLAVLALIGALGGLGAAGVALAQTKAPPPKEGPKDKSVQGEFTPARVNADQEANAKKQESGKGALSRGRIYFFPWGSLTPAEFDGLGRQTMFLLAIWTQKPEELPVKRIFHRSDAGETAIYKVSSWKTPVDAGSVTARIYGPNREDGFYLVPGNVMLGKGQLVIELSANQPNWILLELPSTVASAGAKRFPNATAAPGRPSLGMVQELVRRKFTGFPVPQSLP